MGVMSPDGPRHESNGIKAGLCCAAKRSSLTGPQLRGVANLLWRHYTNLDRVDFANGLREGMYIASQTRQKEDGQ